MNSTLISKTMPVAKNGRVPVAMVRRCFQRDGYLHYPLGLRLHGHEGAVDLLRAEVELEPAEGGRPGEAGGGVEAVAPEAHALQAAVDRHAVRERAEAAAVGGDRV